MTPRMTAVTAALLGALGSPALAENAPSPDQNHGSASGMMQDMQHGETMKGTGQGGMMDVDQAHSSAGHGTHGAEATSTTGSPATQAYRAANLAMHEAMNLEFTDNADIDFARGMIGHHRGAIDMARIVLEHGEDPDLRQLAEEVIEAQEAEIAFLENWIAENVE